VWKEFMLEIAAQPLISRGIAVGIVAALLIPGANALADSAASALLWQSASEVSEETSNGTIVVSSLNNTGPGTLRRAIEVSNKQSGKSLITFSVSGAIKLDSRLPAIAGRVQIDGTTAPGYVPTGPPVVQLNHRFHQGLRFVSGSRYSKLLGLSITRAGGHGVTIHAKSIVIDQNYIGLSPSGRSRANTGAGIYLAKGSARNKIGLNVDEQPGVVANVISGNGGSGILISGSSHNTIVANRIGTNPAGEEAVPNGKQGIAVANGSKKNVVGGTAYTNPSTGEENNPTGSKGKVTPTFEVPALGNLVSANRKNGILLASGARRNVLFGNFVGTTSDGNAALGNRGNGVRIREANNNKLIGCTFQENPFVYYNVLSGNHKNGLQITDSDDVLIQANFFGVGANNTAILANRLNGIQVDGSSQNTQVGGVIPLGNVAAGNGRNGIEVRDSVTGFITFNTFGGLLAFKGAAPNQRNGLLITSTGGDNSVRTNVFSGNAGNGIKLAKGASGVSVDPNIAGATTDAKSPLPNGGHGLAIAGRAHHNTIGGPSRSVIPQNTFSANDGFGIAISGTANRNRIFGGFLGTKVFGEEALPNGRGGILLKNRAHRNKIGTGKLSPANLISGNTGNGITFRKKTVKNKLINVYVGLSRSCRALPNSGSSVIDKGTSNVLRGVKTQEGDC
jgi:parallel beta-helix repeat protein